MHVAGEAILALCYFKKEGDQNNALYLSKDHLFVREKGVLSNFEIDAIQNITFGHRVILLPIIIGGILAPLSLHALLNHYYNIWLLFSLVLVGVMLIYYGIQGTEVITLHTAVKNYDYFISSKSLNLESYVSYVKAYKSDPSITEKFYMKIAKDDWVCARQQGVLSIEKSARLYYLHEFRNIAKSEEDVIVSISAGITNVRFQESSEHTYLIPVIDQNIPIEYLTLV